jgi:hypothetical protein
LTLAGLTNAQQTVPGSFGIGNNENAPVLQQETLPKYLLDQLNNPETNKDEALRLQVGKQVDAFIAGNDEEALQTVSELVSTAGFNPIVAGDLSVSRTLENMQLLLIQLGMKYNYNWLAGWKILHN